MILTSKNAETLTEGVEDSIQMEIDESSKAVLMQILSEGLYKDPIGSTIREWTSNALDSHVEAGVDEPVIVSVEQDANWNYWFRVTDFGVGISEERIEKIISKYAASTKRHTNTMLGAFGLGLKSGLSYADSFTFTTRYNGKETTYIMYKAEEGTKLDKLIEIDTDKRNGTTFSISIKSYADKREFINKCKQQLCYFEKVYFSGNELCNDFKIIKTPDWKSSELSEDRRLHLSLDNVYYPLDFTRLGIEPIMVPVALNFNIGEGLEPIPSREDIKYTPSAKALILERIAKMATSIVTKYNESCKDYYKFSDIVGNLEQQTYTLASGHIVLIEELEGYSEVTPVTPVIQDLEMLDLKHLIKHKKEFFSEYSIKGRISSRNRFEGNYTGEIALNKISPYRLIFTEYKPKGVLLEYIKDTYPGAYFLYKTAERKLKNKKYSHSAIEDYWELLGLNNYNRGEYRILITQFQDLLNRELETVIDIKTIVPDEEWLKKRKESKAVGIKTKVTKGEINPKYAERAERGWQGVVFRPAITRELKELHKYKHLTVYGTLEEKEKLSQIFKVSIFMQGRIKVVMVSPRDYDKLTKLNIHNWITTTTFMSGKNKPFRVCATAIEVQEFIESYESHFDNHILINCLDSSLHEKMEELRKYSKNNNIYISDEFKKELLEVADKYGYWDYPVHQYVAEIHKVLSGPLDFVKVIPRGYYEQPKKELLSILVDGLKHRKYKLNMEHYNTKLPLTIKKEEEEELEENFI